MLLTSLSLSLNCILHRSSADVYDSTRVYTYTCTRSEKRLRILKRVRVQSSTRSTPQGGVVRSLRRCPGAWLRVPLLCPLLSA